MPGLTFQPRLHGIAMKYKAVGAHGEDLVAQRLQHVGVILRPPAHCARREGFRRNDGLAVNVPGRSHLFAKRHQIVRPGGRASPEFAHGHIDATGVLHILVRPIAVRFNREPEAMLIAQFPHVPGVIFQQKVGDGAAQIPQETLGGFSAFHRPAGKHGQIADGIITAALYRIPRGIRASSSASPLPNYRCAPSLSTSHRRRPDRPGAFRGSLRTAPRWLSC